MSAPTREAVERFYQIYTYETDPKPLDSINQVDSEQLFLFVERWYAQGRRDGVEEYTTGKLAGTVRDVESVPTPPRKV